MSAIQAAITWYASPLSGSQSEAHGLCSAVAVSRSPTERA